MLLTDLLVVPHRFIKAKENKDKIWLYNRWSEDLRIWYEFWMQAANFSLRKQSDNVTKKASELLEHLSKVYIKCNKHD